MAHVNPSPPAMAVAPDRLGTLTGVELVLFVPSPSSPRTSSPQHATAPLEPVSAHAWCHPAVTTVAPVSPVTATGAVDAVVVPFPSWPDVLFPQHQTPPSVSTAHAKSRLA